MAEDLDILNMAVSFLIKAGLFAARFSGQVRRQSLKRLATAAGVPNTREVLPSGDTRIDCPFVRP
jgi:hypothetical protein